MLDPTRSLDERTQGELFAFADDHLLMALEAAELIHGDRQLSEDHLRDRLVALSDTYTDRTAVARENARRRMDRLRAVLQSAD